MEKPLFPGENLLRAESLSLPASIAKRRRVSPFIRLFREHSGKLLCPNFWMLAWANGCPYHCSYCYLQGTFKGETDPIVFSNLKDMLREVSRWLAYPGETRLLNTGELCDSLAITDVVMKLLIPLFGRQSRHKLLLLTKSDRVDGLLKLPHNGQTIISFSLNPPEVSRLYEPDAPPPGKRLEAARKCVRAGYRLHIRVDPMIPVEGWRKAYSRLAEEIAELKPERVTLGCLRLYPSVKAFSQRSKAVFQYVSERTPDGRFRPPEKTRIEMYQLMLSKLQGLEVGICKELPSIHEALKPSPLCNCIP